MWEEPGYGEIVPRSVVQSWGKISSWQYLFTLSSFPKPEWIWMGLQHHPRQQTQNMWVSVPGKKKKEAEGIYSRTMGITTHMGTKVSEILSSSS